MRSLRACMIAGLAWATLAASSQAAFAHQARTTFTLITWNADTGALEVEHRIDAHDAEFALSAPNAPPLDLTTVRDQARVALYAQRAFSLSTSSGAIPLTLVGAELDGDTLSVFGEATLPARPESLLVKDTFFTEAYDDQTNFVSIRFGSRPKTLIFRNRDTEKTASGLG